MTTASLRIADRYELLSPVGRGGSGTVWRARDRVLDRDVAVKQVRLPDSLAPDERDRLRERVLREARAAAGLRHRYVVTVHDVIDEDGDVFVIMELVAAPTLADIIDVRGPLDDAEAATLGTAILEALEAAHGDGIVHRDVKPSNVIVVGNGEVRLTDFGIAAVPDDPTLTRSGVVLGSPSYVAPEQVRGDDVGAAADYWGLGATLYHAVEGVAPFAGDDDGTIEAVTGSRPRPAERVQSLGSLLRDLLQKDPAARPRPAQIRERLAMAADDPASVGGDPEEAKGQDAAPAPTYSFDAVDEAEATGAGPDDGHVRYRFDDTARGDEQPRVSEDTGSIAGNGTWGTTRTGDASGDLRRLLIAGGILAGMLVVAALLVFVPGPVQEQQTTAGEASSPQAASAPADAGSEPAGGSSPRNDAGNDAGDDAGNGTNAPQDETGGAADRDVPDDWVVSEGDTYRVAHPAGWQTEQLTASTTQYRDPETRTYIRVTREGEQQDPVGEWEAYSRQFAAEREIYEEIRIEPYEVKGRSGAIWEYRYEASGVTLHAVNIKIPADGRGYAFNLQSHADNWGEASALLDTFLAGFQPTP